MERDGLVEFLVESNGSQPKDSQVKNKLHFQIRCIYWTVVLFPPSFKTNVSENSSLRLRVFKGSMKDKKQNTSFFYSPAVFEICLFLREALNRNLFSSFETLKKEGRILQNDGFKGQGKISYFLVKMEDDFLIMYKYFIKIYIPHFGPIPLAIYLAVALFRVQIFFYLSWQKTDRMHFRHLH